MWMEMVGWIVNEERIGWREIKGEIGDSVVEIWESGRNCNMGDRNIMCRDNLR